MRYFLHDTNAFQDEKITELYINFGYEGLGLFYTILEKLALQEKPIKTIVLKKQLNVKKRLEKCWKFMESLEIISSNNDETFSKQLLNFSEKYQIKKEKNRKRISEWRKNQGDEKNVTCNNVVRNTPKVKRSKDKRKYIKETPPKSPKKNNPFLKSEKEKIIKKATDFYKKEKDDNKKEKYMTKYENFINYIFKENEIGEPFVQMLQMKNQLTYKQYKKLLAKEVDLKQYVDACMNDFKYLKGKTSIYLTFLNWSKR